MLSRIKRHRLDRSERRSKQRSGRCENLSTLCRAWLGSSESELRIRDGSERRAFNTTATEQRSWQLRVRSSWKTSTVNCTGGRSSCRTESITSLRWIHTGPVNSPVRQLSDRPSDSVLTYQESRNLNVCWTQSWKEVRSWNWVRSTAHKAATEIRMCRMQESA